MIPDTHAHLEMIKRAPADVVAAAVAAGVSPIITIGTTTESSKEAVRIASEFEEVFASVGIHPNDSGSVDDIAIAGLEQLVKDSSKVVAIGETGLDFYRDRTRPEVQMRSFIKHIELAKRTGKTLIVHDREAHKETLQTLADAGPLEVPVILHCFSGDREMLMECLDRGYYISWAGPVTFRKNDEARELTTLVPIDRILVETDAPFLSPEPFRGKPNEPARVRHTAEVIAAARAMPIEELEVALERNTREAFSLPA